MINMPKGTKDALPKDTYKWQYVESKIRSTARLFGFDEIRTPTIEFTELFLRGVGENTDIVDKEMYTFMDKGGRSLTLRPEGTAGVVRSYIENNLADTGLPVKLYYIGPAFRYERPQSGRLREHHQFGAELFGSATPYADAQVISLAKSTLTALGLKDVSLNINSVGCRTCRPVIEASIKSYFCERIDELCEVCKERLIKNPLRILDCKEARCKEIAANAPYPISNLCPECSEHHQTLVKLLNDTGVEFTVDPHIVRGLDYYTRTVFEFISSSVGAQGTICGGGRYDNLTATLGGKPTPSVGFGIGIERILMAIESASVYCGESSVPDLYIVSAGAGLESYTFSLAEKLRASGIATESDIMGRSLKAQMKCANKIGAKYVVVVGEDEISTGLIFLKNMKTGEEKAVDIDAIVNILLASGV
ncbi:MAG: histidine--tRNA ligase [Christensenellaceae bacterium]|jgi:histidyl-tRNA synthetase|nr:histidine--tRNA ligase [Christensenellaceae bacterium]